MKDFSVLVSSILRLYMSNYYWHWQTNSYAEHKTFDKLHSDLDELKDRLVEVGQGAYNLKVTQPNSINFISYSNRKEGIDELIGIVSNYIKECQEDTVKNVLVDINECLNKYKYLLTLK